MDWIAGGGEESVEDGRGRLSTELLIDNRTNKAAEDRLVVLDPIRPHSLDDAGDDGSAWRRC